MNGLIFTNTRSPSLFRRIRLPMLSQESAATLVTSFDGRLPRSRSMSRRAPANSHHERRRFYRIARRSAVECAAILDVAARLGLVRDVHQRTREDLVRIVGGTVRLIQSCERRSGQEQGQG
jgi:hypothetical protein